MIRPILRVILDDEDRRLLPVAAARDRLDDSAEGEVVLGDHRARSESAGRRGTCMVASEADDRELRQIAVTLEGAEFLQPDIRPGRIRHGQIEGGIRGVHQPLETRHCRVHLAALPCPRGELTVAAHADPAAFGEVPDVAERRGREVAVVAADLVPALAQVRCAAVPVVGRPQLLDHIGRVGGHRERMTVIADFGIDIEVVEQRERARKRMRVRRDLLAEERERLSPLPPGMSPRTWS